MKTMEEDILIKNGEIKILRDSLHQTEFILEEQRRSHFLLEQEKTQALSDKEKEFSKKVSRALVLFVMDIGFVCQVPVGTLTKAACKSSRKI